MKLTVPKPIWAVKKEKGQSISDAYLKWLKEAYNFGVEQQKPITDIQLSNLLLYQGIHDSRSLGTGGVYPGPWPGDESEGLIDPRVTKELVINDLFDTVQQISNKLSKFNITTLAVPHSTEASDREGASVVRDIMETIKYRNNMVHLYREMIKESIILGESYVSPLWDENKADIHKAWLAAKKKFDSGKSVKTITVNGKEVPFDLEDPVRIGDVAYRRFLPWEKILDYKFYPRDVEYVIFPRFVHIEVLKFDYPDKADKIKVSSNAHVFDMNSLMAQRLEEHVLVLELYGKSTRFLNHGLRLIATPEVILEESDDNPYPIQEDSEWGNLPLERLTDIDIPGSLTPISTFQILAPLQKKENQFYTQIAKNLLLGAHFKMLRPRQGKINPVTFGNDSTYIDYIAPYEPKMLSMATVPGELFSFLSVLAQKFTQLQGIQPISKGEEGPNIRSAKMIDALLEIESVRGSDRIQKKNDLVVAVDKKTLAIIGKYYKNDEERLINIIGKDKKPLIRAFDISVLNKPYDVRMLALEGLPEDPTARLRTVSGLMQTPGFKELLTNEQWADILDLKTPERFFSAMDATVLKAEWENQQFIENKDVPDVVPGDEHATHWNTHMVLARSRDYLLLPDAARDALDNHIQQHELKIMDTLQVFPNPMYQQRVAMLVGFPAYVPPLPPAPPSVMQQAPPGGQPPAQGGQPPMQGGPQGPV